MRLETKQNKVTHQRLGPEFEFPLPLTRQDLICQISTSRFQRIDYFFGRHPPNLMKNTPLLPRSSQLLLYKPRSKS